ncbi:MULTISPECIES: aspartate kinase [Thermodesulfovibrio]|jgi:aspartate kinase|uniref:Aspartokinase n=1 Tax=Thermodesulfovibrio yellowstonii (strain ATCC 51303 / DSM 11347 / YP87) TaxID=289376 RepID=B5YGC1_THEYD|nr:MULTISPECIES: aspartate kinase [Thermodesulfovibrio]ACI20954.1 asparate kinase, monofunctional class [Thermodesulfovibrio yellowstonii DSM 11347]MDI6865159.1 aspartate kinase [Thermodesulfovibrio yellowstonii]
MLIVQKYGGTSVANIERIKAVAERVSKTAKEGNKVVVVVSAMAGETDKLIGLAHQVCSDPPEREMDLLLSSGERVTAALTAMALYGLGHKAIALTGRQMGIITDAVHTKARIEKIIATRAVKALEEGYIVVVAGFQGITEDEDVTTLGRGGSDLTAVAIAAALNADLCEIYTDVDGVFTADPNIAPNARKLEKISYEEMLELASLGAKVLQTRSVEFAMKYNVPVVVRSSFNWNPGTLVTKEDKDMEKVVVSGIAHDKNQAKITILKVPDRPGIAAKLFKAVADANIVVDMIVQNISSDGKATDISFTVPKTDAKKALELTEKISKELGAEGVLLNEDIAKISIVGVGMRTHSGVAAQMFEALANHGINIMAISTSEIKISCLINAKYTELAIRVLHDTFKLGEQ